MPQRARNNWLASLSWQVDFYFRSGRARRKDTEFEWKNFEFRYARHAEIKRLIRSGLHKLGLRPAPAMTLDWLREHAEKLWEARSTLADDLSKLLFDSALVLRITSHKHFYFPRIDFEDLVEILAEQAFLEPGYPREYLGMPLRLFDVRINRQPQPDVIRIITREIQLRLVNSYRQYLVRRNGIDISPASGDVVYDCGACIGEVSLLFASMVAPLGEVHLFDPIALHTRFCELQTSMNPDLGTRIHINTCAVGDQSHAADRTQEDATSITPGAIIGDDFPCTTLDDYAASHPGRVDFIKMDIEGAELRALSGASSVLREFRPRLAISGYHKPEDLWEIPAKLKSLHPGYEITFGHHTPIFWESVFYAVDRSLDVRRARHA
jgi:FkbM family methyltransferase